MIKNKLIIKNVLMIINLIIFFFLIFIGRNQYIYNMNYFKCIMFMLVNCIFIFIYGIVLDKEKTYKSNILIYIVFYFLLLVSITFFIGRTNIGFYTWWYSGQYKPFHTITSQFKYASNPTLLKNVFGNSIMLIPLSFLLIIKSKKCEKIRIQTIIILPIILIIELFQAFTHTGAFDIDDIILNYIGIVIFTFIITRFNIIDKIRKLFYTDFKLGKNIKEILFYSSFLLVLIFDILLFFR